MLLYGVIVVSSPFYFHVRDRRRDTGRDTGLNPVEIQLFSIVNAICQIKQNKLLKNLSKKTADMLEILLEGFAFIYEP